MCATEANATSSNTSPKRPMSSKEILAASPAVVKRLSKAPETSDLRLRRADSALLPPRGRLNTNSTDDHKRLTASVHADMDLSTSARVFSNNSQAAAAPTYGPRSNVSAYSRTGSSFMPVVVPRHRSKVDAGSNLTEATATNLPVVDPKRLLKGHLVVDHGKECQHVFPSKCSASERKYVTATSGDGDINCFGPLCTESVESNELGDWYDVSDLEKTISAVGTNPEFTNVNRTAVLVGKGCLRRSYERSQYAPTLQGLVVHYLQISNSFMWNAFARFVDTRPILDLISFL